MKIERHLTRLQSNSAKQQQAALVELSLMGKSAKPALPEIARFLDSPDELMRRCAIIAYAKIANKDAIEILRKYHQDPHPMPRAVAALMSSKIGDKAHGYPVMREMLRSSDVPTQKAAKIFLDQIDRDFHPEKPCAAELNSASNSLSSSRLQTSLETKFAGEIEVTICLCDGESNPTSLQQQILDQVRRLPAKVKRVIQRELLRRLIEEDDDADPSDDLEVEFTSVTIPPVRNSASYYYFLQGNSDYDLEHGFACAINADNQLCICSTELPLTNFNCDEFQQLDQLFSQETILKI